MKSTGTLAHTSIPYQSRHLAKDVALFKSSLQQSIYSLNISVINERGQDLEHSRLLKQTTCLTMYDSDFVSGKCNGNCVLVNHCKAYSGRLSRLAANLPSQQQQTNAIPYHI